MKTLFAGTLGPYTYDETSVIVHSNPAFNGHYRNALVTDGQLIVLGTPTIDFHVARKIDIERRDTRAFYMGGYNV